MGKDWTHDSRCDAVANEIRWLAEVAPAIGAAEEVPTCPGWTVAKVLRHTGTVHRWATAMVTGLAQERLDPRSLDLGLPADDAGLPAWLGAGAGPLVDALRAADPDAPMWSWGPDGHVRFWSRRMLHETTIHRVDVELAGDAESSIRVPVAVDGIDELLANLPSTSAHSPAVAELRGTGAIGFRCSDTGDAWTVALREDGFGLVEPGSVPETATLEAGAVDLYLTLYRRRFLDQVKGDIQGDGQLITWWLARSQLQ